jgi:hypothetical protein
MAGRRRGKQLDSDRRFPAMVFRSARRRASGHAGTLTTSIFVRRKHDPHTMTTFISLYRHLPMRLAAAFESSA